MVLVGELDGAGRRVVVGVDDAGCGAVVVLGAASWRLVDVEARNLSDLKITINIFITQPLADRSKGICKKVKFRYFWLNEFQEPGFHTLRAEIKYLDYR